MQLITTAIVASALFLGASAFNTDVNPRAADTDTCGYLTTPLLRAYQAALNDHLYTASADDMEFNIVVAGFVSEGDAATVYSTQVPYSVPLFRLWSRNLTDHFYTINPTERDAFIKSGHYVDEGITAYVYVEHTCGSMPLFRMFNPSIVDHFYTTNDTEKEIFITQRGYVDEGITAYVSPKQATN